jgi:hypothetical protein
MVLKFDPVLFTNSPLSACKRPFIHADEVLGYALPAINQKVIWMIRLL